MTEETIRSYNSGRQKQFRMVVPLLMVFLWLVSISCDKKPAEGSIVIAQELPGESLQSELALVDPHRPDKDPFVLVNEFHEVASPEISYPGDKVLFQAKKESGDSWQIWEYDFESEELNQVTDADSDCKDPTYLPDGRIVYCRFVPDYSGYHVLETCQSNGTETQQITFGPVDFSSPTVLRDGRILAFAKEAHPKSGKSQLMVMRPDGTKIELFYESGEQSTLVSDEGLFQTEDNRIVFSEKARGEEAKAHWFSVDYDYPSGSRMRFEAAKLSDLKQVVYAPRPRPKKLPSAVNPEVETALLVCMDANLSEKAASETQGKSVKVELLGLEGSLGTVDLEDDGSVYMKIQANMPFRMQTLDSQGEVVEGPSSWLQMRPNERRGCVGCHAGHTRVPENRQPLAVQKEPVEIPLYRETIMASRLIKNEKK